MTSDWNALEDLLKRRFVFLDTCVLIASFEDYDVFEPLYHLIKKADCAPTHFSFIEFEFVKGARKPSHRAKREEFVRKIDSNRLPMAAEEMTNSATEIANLYAGNGHDTASLVDCCIAAYMRKYRDNLFLVTLNHRDFPPLLFEPLAIMPLEAGVKWYHLGFYRFIGDMV